MRVVDYVGQVIVAGLLGAFMVVVLSSPVQIESSPNPAVPLGSILSGVGDLVLGA